MQVIVDDREPLAGPYEYLCGMPNMKITRRRLQTGDYLLDNRILFERKTAPDFGQSLIDGRLFAQAIRLRQTAMSSVLILEGNQHAWTKTGIRWEALQGALITLSVLLGIPVLRSSDAPETAKLMVQTAMQVDRVAKGGLARPGYRPHGKRRRQLYILQGLPGIGPQRAERLLDTFGSVEAVIGANVLDLCSVEGVGKQTAKSIRQVVQEARVAYGS